jgi:hypothetical protein
MRLPSFLKTDSTLPQRPDQFLQGKHCSVSKVDPASRTARRASQTVELAPKKFALLLALPRARGAVVSRLQVMREVWGYSATVVSRTVDIHIGVASQNSRRARPRFVTLSPCERPATGLSSDEKFGYSAANIPARVSRQGRVIRSFTRSARFAKGLVDASRIVPLLLVPERCHRIDSTSSPRRNPAGQCRDTQQKRRYTDKTERLIAPLVIA